jgi:FKBP-type peptidyl-prolyl cis-trans isomerase
MRRIVSRSKWATVIAVLAVVLSSGTARGVDTPKPLRARPGNVAMPKTDLPPTTTASGLKYIDLKVGSGATPQKGQIAIVHYAGWLDDGTKIDASRDHGKPFGFRVGMGQVIKGWDEGVASMKVGGVRRLIIPPELGYGAKGVGKVVPPNARLTFDIELLDIRP